MIAIHRWCSSCTGWSRKKPPRSRRRRPAADTRRRSHRGPRRTAFGAPHAAGCTARGTATADVRVRQRAHLGRRVPAPRDPSHPAALLGRLRPPFRDGNGRTTGALIYWVDAQPALLAGRVPHDLEDPQAGTSEVRPLIPVQRMGRLPPHLLHAVPPSIIVRAIDELHSYLVRKMREVREVERGLSEGGRIRCCSFLPAALR